MENENYSFDLETLGKLYDSYILSIGCAKFNINTGDILGTFHMKTVCDRRFNIDVNTVMWWLGQSESARTRITNRSGEVLIAAALFKLQSFITDHENAKVWGNGSSFDISLLDHAYSVTNLTQPWKYSNVRDMRTIVDVAESRGFSKDDIVFKGVKHDALADSVHQAKVISAAYNAITG